jgi:hypothetical protein
MADTTESIADAERVEAAIAVLQRRYPGIRPDSLDNALYELRRVARSIRQCERDRDLAVLAGLLAEYPRPEVPAPRHVTDIEVDFATTRRRP